ncbi:RNA-binding domain-containing protein [Gramella sp. AN32]|uniref:RNA-binding domain-containing protein n=1 Tax=Christiangramia antarctica TaxID=2058158 RepID=A0ABW5X7G0_9FLAO|nr:RNA-binding domain-containing protein [Gramella sp. AN32]MCM4154412.1 AAA family ATPase [Gramella sp. AN32]
MTSERIKEILQKGESTDVEFKTAEFELNKDVFESICAFLNRKGGHLLLGVKDDGTVQGIIEDCVQDINNNIVTMANNPQKLNPPFYLSPQVIDYGNKKIIYVFVPESSQVHSSNGKIFDRNEDGDFNITGQTERVTQLYLRKQSIYSENKIYPYLNLSDFKQDLFTRVRTLARNQRANHPWLDMDNEEMMRSAGLFKHDHQTGKNGYTLAAVLLFGKDEVIQSVLPHHKTDAILRVENIDRYDDRDDIRTNLVESYDRLMDFIRKHLPDKFYQEGEQRISLRDHIFREIVGNLLIHREYANAFPAKLVIEKEKVITENWNRPHDGGLIDPANFSPYPKNPVIAKFFKEIGRVDELGSGVRNTFKYCSIYTPGTNPEFVEDDIFKAVIPLQAKEDEKVVTPNNWEEVRKKFGERFGESSEKILELIFNDQYISASAMAEVIGITERAVEKQIAKLKEKDVIKRVGPNKGGYWKINL